MAYPTLRTERGTQLFRFTVSDSTKGGIMDPPFLSGLATGDGKGLVCAVDQAAVASSRQRIQGGS